jgi:adenine-specific DNA-methyltransferase
LEADLVQENCSILFYRNGHNNSQKKPSMPEFGKEADIAKARQHLAELIKRFEEQHESYKGPHYNETMTRRDFIDPLFKALGWDIDNEQGFAEAYREVIHEDKIKIGKTTKAPDYSFRLPGGKRLFFVEAKKPGINIRDAHEPAYQLRRYGWNAKLPISIITNFEEFAIYDCTKKPLPNDKSSVARINYFNYAEYLDRFDLLYISFSKTQALKGSFDKFVQSTAGKRGTATVDVAFLQSLNDWRKYLATSISWNNKLLDEEEINFAVQQTIDRIIFMRIAEARDIEPFGNLKRAVKQGVFYRNLFELFRVADEKYNSGLFDFQKDKISETLTIDNKVIKTIVEELYYPQSPYDFAVMAVEILGSAYEQFLGKVIRITPGHRAKIEEKPEVRKSGGVYYTPQYIVDFIVKSTVGKVIENKTPSEVAQLKIVDPACGAGSFLIGAYQYLLDWHYEFYKNNKAKAKKKRAFNDQGRLSTTLKKEILLNNIFGVDIDANAVEVTKLSLLLKCLEGETEASVSHQLMMFNERVLPSLDNNIKSGNSLINTDFYDFQLSFGDERKIKPFDWKAEFPEVFSERSSIVTNDFKERFKKIRMQYEKNEAEIAALLKKYNSSVEEPEALYGQRGGFDLVLGNPPYFSLSTLDAQSLSYFSSNYKVYERTSDIYCLFFEKAVSILRPNGIVAFITSNQWMQTNYGRILRQFIVKNANPELLINFGGFKIFPQATVDTSILMVSKKPCEYIMEACHFKNDYVKETPLEQYFEKNKILISSLEDNRWIIAEESDLSLKEKIKLNGKPLSNFGQIIHYGIKTGFNKAFIINNETRNLLIAQDSNSGKIIKPILRGRDVHKYYAKWANLWLVVTKNGINIKDYPAIHNYLKDFTPAIKKRTDQGDRWWNLRACNYYHLFDEEKIIYPETTVRRSEFYLDRNQMYIDKTCFMITGNHLPYLNGVLSSRLMEWYLETELRRLGRKSIQYSKQFIELIPIPEINTENASLVDEISMLVIEITDLNQSIQNMKLQNKIDQVIRKARHLESRINLNVYKLFGLTDQEIATIESH